MSEVREIIHQLCETHGYATVLDSVRASMECTLKRFQEYDWYSDIHIVNCEQVLKTLALTIPPADLIPMW